MTRSRRRRTTTNDLNHTTTYTFHKIIKYISYKVLCHMLHLESNETFCILYLLDPDYLVGGAKAPISSLLRMSDAAAAAGAILGLLPRRRRN
jgi:hypothetical protein